jgi:drug/metabolite transporter (DMT)-like permease
MQKNKLNSFLHFHFIVFIFGFTAILGSLISVSSLSLVWYRMLIAFVILILFAIIFKINIKVSNKILIKLLFCGVLISLHWITFFQAIKVSNVSITLSVLSLGAFLTSFLEPLFYKRKIIPYEIFLIFKSQYYYIEGIFYALISVFLSVVFGLLNGKLIKESSSLVITIYELLGGVILITLILIFLGDFNTEFFKLSNSDWFWLLLLGSVCTAYAFVISVEVLKHLSPYSLMISINMEPVYGIILAIIILNENSQLSIEFYIGFIIIFISVILNGIIKLRKNKII